MDREGFRNRLKQYKLAREENPGLKYWEWKNIPKYDEGGEVVDPIELMLKRRNVAINMQGKPNQFLDEWNTARLATGRFDAQLGNGNLELQKANRDSAPIFSTPNAFASRAALRGVVPIRLSSDTDQMVIDRYNSDLRVLANKLFKTVTSAEEGKERKGAYDQNSHTIYVKPDSPETLIHEQSHASKARPQEAKIAEILKNNDETKSLYYDDPTGREPYGRLMQVREANQIDPNKVWDKESYKEFKKNAIDFNFLNRYSDDTVIDIFNNVADAGNIQNEENKIFVAAEGGIVPKYYEGTRYVERYSTEENPILYKEESAKDRYIRAVAELKAAGGWSDNLRTKIANEYSIPYLPEKEIRLTTGRYNTGKISTNLLDSIYNSAMRTGVPVDIALGLAGRESTLGIGRGFKKGQSINGTNLMSNWLQIDPDIPASKDRDKFNDIRAKILFHDNVSDDEYNFSADYIFDDINSRKRLKKIKENPIDNALKFYQSGKYNPGDKRHSQMVEEDAKILMSDPAIKKWALEKGIAYAEGGEITGPPTYEQWYADMNQYNPTILDNASMYWSIEAAKKALHNEAMKLPGYAERWTEYQRSLPKPDPDIDEYIDNLWLNENPNNKGYKNGKYYPHSSPEGGTMTIGPGFKLGSGSHNINTKEANRGMTKTRLNQEARRSAKRDMSHVKDFLNYGQTTNPADTVSPDIIAGLMDLTHLVGPLWDWKKLRGAVLEGDLDKIKKEPLLLGKIKLEK